MHGNRPITIEVLLSYAPLFEGLEQEALARIAKRTCDIRLARNDPLFLKGELCDGFHLVVHGQIKLFFTSAQGAEKIVDILGQDRTFGEALMLAEQPYMVSAQALSESLLLHIPKAAVMEEFDTSPGLRLKLLTHMSARLNELMADGQSYSRESGTRRFINYLMLHLPEASAAEDGGLVVLPTSKGNVASQLNLTKEHFSRILQALSKLGLIEVRGRRISIPDVARLNGHGDGEQPSFQPRQKGGCGGCGGTAAAGCGRTVGAGNDCRP